MNHSRFKQKIDGQSTLAKKVFDCAPKKEFWTGRHIVAELIRQKKTISIKQVEGCLYSLRDSKLVIERNGTYQQVNVVKEKQTLLRKAERVEPMAKKKRSAMDILDELRTKLKTLQDEVETAALEITEYIEQKEAGAEKITKLKPVLAGRGVG